MFLLFYLIKSLIHLGKNVSFATLLVCFSHPAYGVLSERQPRTDFKPMDPAALTRSLDLIRQVSQELPAVFLQKPTHIDFEIYTSWRHTLCCLDFLSSIRPWFAAVWRVHAVPGAALTGAFLAARDTQLYSAVMLCPARCGATPMF